MTNNNNTLNQEPELLVFKNFDGSLLTQFVLKIFRHDKWT